MKKTVMTSVALLAPGAGIASAQINLSWNDCGNAGSFNRAFICTSDSGTNQLISSFFAQPNMTAINGAALVFNMQTAGGVLQPWWDFGGCREASALAFSTDFSLVPGTGACVEIFGSALGSGSSVAAYGGPDLQRLEHEFSLASDFPSLTPGDEVYASRIQISNLGTVGGCSGCLMGACIVLYECNVTQVPGTPGGNFRLFTAADRNYVTWQGGTGTQCPLSTAKATWGQIKSLYR